MERLYLYLDKEVLKARKVESYETLTNPIVWKDLEFEYTTSPLLMINWPIILPELSPATARSLLDLVGSRYPFAPNYHQLKTVCPQLLFTITSDEWIFFGGSFNPWHKGHQACLDLLPPEKLCFILPDRNPLKELQVLEPVATVLQLVSKIKFSKNHYIAPTFLLDFQKNPTVTWIEKLHQDYPTQKHSLLMGFDSLKGVSQWVRANDLLKMLHTLYVVSRLEEDDEREAVSAPLKKINPNLHIEFLGRHGFENLSSTTLRK
ncbi:MAG: hypothetical protein H0V66_10665 [Bdellovibrionales bacterium]|nr:hypothetical protein [Bdellovibrionales bacterium]